MPKPPVRASPSVQLEQRDEESLVHLSRRDPLEAHPLAGQTTREAPQLAGERVGERAGRIRRQRRQPWTARALDDPRSPRQHARGRVRGGAPQEQRRPRRRRSKPGADRLATLARHEPLAVVARPRAASSVHIHRNRDRQPPVQALAIAAQRHQRLQPARARAPCGNPGGRPSADRLPPRQDPVRCLEVRAALVARGQLQPVSAERRQIGGILEVQDLDGRHALDSGL